MRYAIIGATIDNVQAVGGVEIKVAARSGIIYATLTEAQAARLKALGWKVTPINAWTEWIRRLAG